MATLESAANLINIVCPSGRENTLVWSMVSRAPVVGLVIVGVIQALAVPFLSGAGCHFEAAPFGVPLKLLDEHVVKDIPPCSDVRFGYVV